MSAFRSVLFASVLLAPASASAEDTPPVAHELNLSFLQYGLSFTGEIVVDAGAICSSAPQAPCIFGSGAGIAIRVGKRWHGPFYLGAAYEFSKQDPQQLYRLAILQQVRAEARYYLFTGKRVEPYLAANGGLVGYGNLWGIDTAGPMGAVGAGAELPIGDTRAVLGLGLYYRLMYFAGFHDTTNTQRDGGFASLISFDLVILETRDPL